MDSNAGINCLGDTNRVSEPPKDSEMNNLGDSVKTSDREETVEGANPQTRIGSDDTETQNGNCGVTEDVQNLDCHDSEMQNLEDDSVSRSDRVETVENIHPQSVSLQPQPALDVTEKQNGNCNTATNTTDSVQLKSLKNVDSSLCNSKPEIEHKVNTSNGKLSEAVIKISRPLCADYRSDSDSESVDSESDSSVSSTDTTTESSSESEDDSDDSCSSSNIKMKSKKESRKTKRELTLYDLPPIEDLVISLPEDACVEVGTITSIVDTLVVVESYKGTAALDIDTVLFLDNGKRTLGKVYDILGPITEPVYAVRFNSPEQIKDLSIEKGLKVYYAPKTQHTNFVFMAEVLKNRGSDASWKDNTEAPPEFQDFSDDEEERLHRRNQMYNADGENYIPGDQNGSRKRPFAQPRQNRALQPNTFRNPNFSQRKQNFQRFPPNNQFPPPQTYSRPTAPHPYPYESPHRGPSSPTPNPYPFLPPRISGPPFPSFGGAPFLNQNQNFHQPYFQQRSHPQNFGGWGHFMLRPPPPPPPPPPGQNAQQTDERS